MPTSRRFAILAERDINKETFVEPWPEAGLIVADSPYDPKPNLRLDAGRVVEMDGKLRPDFDSLDAFIADHALDLAVAEEAMATPALADCAHVGRHQRAADCGAAAGRWLHPSQAGRDYPAHERAGDDGWPGQDARAADACNQVHVTNWKEQPALLAADAAEGPLRGFAEVETTVRVARNAPFNALAILVGTQTGRGGVLTQRAVEEALGLRSP